MVSAKGRSSCCTVCSILRHFIALLAFRVVVLPLGLAPAFLGFFLAAAFLILGAPHCLVLVARLQSSSDQFMPMVQSAMKGVKHRNFMMMTLNEILTKWPLRQLSIQTTTGNKQCHKFDTYLHLHHPLFAQTGNLGVQLPQWPCQCLQIQCLQGDESAVMTQRCCPAVGQSASRPAGRGRKTNAALHSARSTALPHHVWEALPAAGWRHPHTFACCRCSLQVHSAGMSSTGMRRSSISTI